VIGDEAGTSTTTTTRTGAQAAAFVFLTDFIGCLPMTPATSGKPSCAPTAMPTTWNTWRATPTCAMPRCSSATRGCAGADLRPPVCRDPRVDRPQFRTTGGYALPFDPQAVADTERLRARHGYRSDERIAIASVGGTGVGAHLLKRIAAAFPAHEARASGAAAHPRGRATTDSGTYRSSMGWKFVPMCITFRASGVLRPGAGAGGLSTCMEMVATRRPFLSFPLQKHFEQCVHVRRRLVNYDADHAVDYHGFDTGFAGRAGACCDACTRALPTGGNDGAQRAARRIAEVLENRGQAREGQRWPAASETK